MPAKKSGGTRKHGRNKEKCKMYLMLKRHTNSHIKRIEKHLEVHGRNDKQAIEALRLYKRQL